MKVCHVDAKTVKQWLENDEAILIDVREPAEYAAVHVEKAKLIPLSQLTSHQKIDCEGKKLVIHCRSGNRSSKACQALLAQCPDQQVYNLDGGILAWEAEGLDVKRSGKFFLALDRQVQLTMGLLLIIFSVLAYFINPLYIVAASFIGAGLVVAGLTGYCGLAVVMAKMPWNQSTDSRITSCKVN